MIADTVTTAANPAPSFDDAMAFVREHAGDVRLSSGERLVDHAAGIAAIMRTLNVDPPAVLAAALLALGPHLNDPPPVIAARLGEKAAQLGGDVGKPVRPGSVYLPHPATSIRHA